MRYHGHQASLLGKESVVTQLAIGIMAEGADQVASVPNRLTDRVFTNVLSDRDQSSLSELALEFFCHAPDSADADYDPGM